MCIIIIINNIPVNHHQKAYVYLAYSYSAVHSGCLTDRYTNTYDYLIQGWQHLDSLIFHLHDMYYLAKPSLQQIHINRVLYLIIDT